MLYIGTISDQIYPSMIRLAKKTLSISRLELFSMVHAEQMLQIVQKTTNQALIKPESQLKHLHVEIQRLP